MFIKWNNNNKKSPSPGFDLTHKNSAKAPRGPGHFFRFLNLVSGGFFLTRTFILLPMLGHSYLQYLTMIGTKVVRGLLEVPAEVMGMGMGMGL